jgi:hypothetical protein
MNTICEIKIQNNAIYLCSVNEEICVGSCNDPDLDFLAAIAEIQLIKTPDERSPTIKMMESWSNARSNARLNQATRTLLYSEMNNFHIGDWQHNVKVENIDDPQSFLNALRDARMEITEARAVRLEIES